MSRSGVALLLCLLACIGWGCRRDMQDQPKYKPLAQSSFFGDDKASRPLVEDTVARGHLNEDKALYEGKDSQGKDISVFPFPVTQAMMERGQKRYNIFCSPCHDHTGSGYGMVVRRGYKQPPSFHIDRLRNAPVGYYFDVMSHGFGSMPDYATQIPAADRWAIIAYIRALQYSAHASTRDVPENELKKLEGTSPKQ